ncbi:MAG: hypothetical protein ABF760_04255 [Zymomonas mobilis]|uniref:Integral membrane protein n=1 Tax=Zymomonas mobilis TaxID=542 RepID=A0A542VZ90_ZYMMB|nr:hypothetical protein [Zymomonas mobilis]TQL16648.1 hypothetical protein FBY58_0184 [Zymomonas mobilis]
MSSSLEAIKKYLHRNTFALFVSVFLLNIFYTILVSLLAPTHSSFATATCQWDCFWYKEIVSYNYSALPRLYDQNRLAQADWAFFPLYPWATKVFANFSHLSFEWSGLIINLFLWPAVITLSYKDILQRIGSISPFLFSLFFLIYPFNIWYHSQYSESTYGFFLILLIIGSYNNNLLLSSISSFLLSFSRPTGFIVTCIMSLSKFFDNVKNNLLSKKDIFSNENILCPLTIVAGGAGLSLFILYLYHLTGDGLAFAHAEKAWGKTGIFSSFNISYYIHHKNKIIFLFYFFMSLFLLWKMRARKWRLNMLVTAGTLILVCCSGLTSVERYIFSNPLVIEFLAFQAMQLERKKLTLVLILCAIFNFLGMGLWLHHTHLLI